MGKEALALVMTGRSGQDQMMRWGYRGWTAALVFALVALSPQLVLAQAALPVARNATAPPAQPQQAPGARDPALVPGMTSGGNAEDLAQTEMHLRAYLKGHDDAADAHYLLAYTLFREAKAKESLAEYTRAAALRRPTAKDLQVVALDYSLLSDYEDADHWMTESVAQQPQDAEAWYDLGRIRYSRNRIPDALRCFQKALAIEPRSVKAENNLGLALEGLNRTEEAIGAYRQAIAWQQDAPHPSAQPLMNLAIVLGNRGELPAALALLQQAEPMAPRDPKVYEQLGRVYSRMNQLPAAQTALERAAALEPHTAAVHFELGQVYRKQGKDTEAKAEFAKVAAINGTHSTDQVH